MLFLCTVRNGDGQHVSPAHRPWGPGFREHRVRPSPDHPEPAAGDGLGWGGMGWRRHLWDHLLTAQVTLPHIQSSLVPGVHGSQPRRVQFLEELMNLLEMATEPQHYSDSTSKRCRRRRSPFCDLFWNYFFIDKMGGHSSTSCGRTISIK